MLGKRKHALLSDSPEQELLRQVITEQIDLEIALKKRLLAAAEARVEWAKVLRESLLEQRTASEVHHQSSFHEVAQRVYEDIEDSCHIISSHKSRLLKPITSGKPPSFPTIPIIEPPRTRKRITLGLANSPPNNGPILYQDRTSGTTVKLTCIDCARSDFPTIQGFLNHCRLAHSRIFNTHDECIQASGIPIDDNEKEAFRLAGVEIHTSSSFSIRGMFERAVGLKGNDFQPMDEDSVSTHLSRTLGVHALTPTLAPFLGKAVRKKQIHVYDEPDPVDIISVEEEEPSNNVLTRRRLKQQKEKDENLLSYHDVLIAMQQVSSLDSARSSEGLPDSDDHSRFRVRRRLIIADRSLYLPEGKRPPDFPSHTHRWQLAVYTPSYGHDISTFLDNFTVTCLTQPPVFSQPIVVCGPPFVACSTTDRPFLARFKLCWVGQQNHAFEIDHWVELSPARLSQPALGEEQMFDIELDKTTPFRQVQDVTSTVPWTGEGDYREIPMKAITDNSNPSPTSTDQDTVKHSTDTNQALEYQYTLRGLAIRFPIVSSGETYRSTPLPYTPAKSLTELFDIPMGTRKALELSRARAIRQEFETMQKNLPETKRSQVKLSTADVFRWLDSSGLYPKPPYSNASSPNADDSAPSGSLQIQAPMVPKYCAVCGVNLQSHSATTANHYRNINCQCSADLERHRAPVIHVYTLLAPSVAPLWNPSQIRFTHKGRDILSVAHPKLLLFAQKQTELLSLSCFPRIPSNSNPLEPGRTGDEVAMTLSPYGTLAVVAKFVLRDLVNEAVRVARDMQTRTSTTVIKADNSPQNLQYILTPNHVLESLVIKDSNRSGRKEVFAKCFSRLGTLLQVDTTLSSQNNNNNNGI